MKPDLLAPDSAIDDADEQIGDMRIRLRKRFRIGEAADARTRRRR